MKKWTSIIFIDMISFLQLSKRGLRELIQQQNNFNSLKNHACSIFVKVLVKKEKNITIEIEI